MSDEGRLVAGRYRLVERIGRGGMGTVWRAEDELLGRQVAVKKLHPPQPHMHEEERATLFERTRREARSAARISHPNVTVVHDVVDDEGLPSIVMEYVPSITLGDLLKREGTLAPAEAARIGRGMVAALRAAHRAGVLHRDVKPGNVLLGEDDRVVLTDFGIAQASGTTTLTRTGELIGSIDFLSPERIKGSTPGPEADLWALGATLYQAVEGRSPFRRDTPIETAYAIVSEDVEPTLNAGPLARLITGLLQKEPADRLSAEDTERMLRLPAAEPDTALVARQVLREQPIAPSPTPQPTPYTVPVTAPHASAPRPRRAGRWIAVVLVASVLAGGGAYTAAKFGGTAAATDGPDTRVTSATAGSPTVAPTATPYKPPPVPEGYRLAKVRDRGYAVPVPNGWSRKVKDDTGMIDYISPDGLAQLTFSALDFASPDHVQHFEQVEADLRKKVDRYRRTRLQATVAYGQPAAVWEFTFQGHKRTFQAVDLGFGEVGRREYAVYLSAPKDQWDEYYPVFENVRDGFRMTEDNA